MLEVSLEKLKPIYKVHGDTVRLFNNMQKDKWVYYLNNLMDNA